MSESRYGIITTYAAWTALSALRSGSPVKAGDQIYPALRSVPFVMLFDPLQGPLQQGEFESWHRQAVSVLCRETGLCVGWAAKLVNVYLKTSSYAGDLGRPGLRAALHPPIDAGLWDGIKARYGKDKEIIRRTHRVRKIKNILGYDEDYSEIIAGCRLIAERLQCALIEVEQFWRPSKEGYDGDGKKAQQPLFEALEGCSVILWDAGEMSEIVGHVVEETNGALTVRAGGHLTIYIGEDGYSRVGRWRLIRKLDGTPLV